MLCPYCANTELSPIFGRQGAHDAELRLRGWWCESCNHWREPVGRERAFTIDNYTEDSDHAGTGAT